MASASRPQRKARDTYHHGNLRQALIDQAVQTIRTHGVEGLTLNSDREAKVLNHFLKPTAFRYVTEIDPRGGTEKLHSHD